MSKPRYLVVGGGGFIGCHLVRELLSRGHGVRVLDNFTTGHRANLDGLAGELEIIEGDIRDRAVVSQAVEGISHILHQAALPSVVRSVADPLTSHEVNVTGTLNLLLAARNAKVERFVFASSSSVYGDTTELPKEEGMHPRPLSPYAIGKLCAEQYCRVFHSLYALNTVVLRYFNVFGPRQDPNSPYSAAIPMFIRAILNGQRPGVKGDGRQTRDFTYVANVVHANLLACTAKDVGGEVFNVGGGQRYSLLDLLSSLGKLGKTPVDPVFEPPRPGDVRDSQADINRAQRSLGYAPIVGFDDGLRETLSYYKSLRETSRPPLTFPR